MRGRGALLAGFLALATGGASAEPMTFELQGNGGNCYTGCQWVMAEGEITADTPAAFEAYSSGGPVIFNSTGGDIQAAMDLGRMIRARDWDTMIGQTQPISPTSSYVEPVEGGRCEGACALAFLGGVTRSIGIETFNYTYGGQLSFERFLGREIIEKILDRSFTGAERLADQAAVGVVVGYLVEMGVSPEVYTRISALDPSGAFAPTLDEAGALGIIPPPPQVGEWSLALEGAGLKAVLATSDSTDELRLFCDRQTGYHLQLAYSDVWFEEGDVTVRAESGVAHSDILSWGNRLVLSAGGVHEPPSFAGSFLDDPAGTRVYFEFRISAALAQGITRGELLLFDVEPVVRANLPGLGTLSQILPANPDPRIFDLAFRNCR